MNNEFKDLFKDLIKDPVSAADKLNDANYKKVLPENVYYWHMKYKGDKPWSDYIVDVLISDFQCNSSGSDFA